MKRTRFSEEQIIGVLKEAEAGAKTGELARRHGVSEATIYNSSLRYESVHDQMVSGRRFPVYGTGRSDEKARCAGVSVCRDFTALSPVQTNEESAARGQHHSAVARYVNENSRPGLRIRPCVPESDRISFAN